MKSIVISLLLEGGFYTEGETGRFGDHVLLLKNISEDED